MCLLFSTKEAVDIAKDCPRYTYFRKLIKKAKNVSRNWYTPGSYTATQEGSSVSHQHSLILSVQVRCIMNANKMVEAQTSLPVM